MALVIYNKIPTYSIFYLLKRDYRLSRLHGLQLELCFFGHKLLMEELLHYPKSLKARELQ